MADASLTVSVLRFLAVMGVFVLPGLGVASWLGRRDGLSEAGRWALGFALSFAWFTVLGWPFLWFGKSMHEFLRVLGPAWAAWSLAGALAWRSARREATVGMPLAVPPDRSPSPSGRERPSVLHAVYAAGVIAAILLYHRLEAHRTWMLRLLPIAVLAGWLVARRIPRPAGSPAPDPRAAPRAWWIAAAVAIGIQAISVAAFDRPDWDDCYYLAAVLDYEHATAFNAEEPSHREGLPVPTQHRTLVWELGGAVLARVAGVSPLALFHSFLPTLLVLFVYAAYATLFGALLPRRLVPLAMLGLSALHVFGISTHFCAANFVLPRLGQSKSVLLHVATPLAVALFLRYAERPSPRACVALLAAVVFGLGASLSAVFLLCALLGGLAAALVLVAPEGRQRRWIVIGAALAVAPLVLAGLGLRAAMHNEVSLDARPEGAGTWIETVRNYLGSGSAELLWLLTLPLLARALRGARARAYLLIFPAVLFATFLNPLLFEPVASSLTSHHTYLRLLWLVPLGPGLGAGLALACDGRRFALPLALGCALGGAALPGLFVWGPRNSFIGPLGTPHLAENVEKMPAELPAIAHQLAADPSIREVRILCDEQIASFLTPWSRDLRFVTTRPLYTPVLFAAGGRTDEGIERYLLAGLLRRGSIAPAPVRDDYDELRMLFGEASTLKHFGPSFARARRDPRELLAAYRVRYAITGPGDAGAEALAGLGYRPLAHGRLTLWSAPGI